MHYYSFNIGDYAVHTRHLSLMEDLAYRRLLDLYYSSEKPINSDTKKVARLIGMMDYPQEIAQVLEDFFILSECGYIQARADDEIAKFHAKADSARLNGRKGGRPKKAKANPEESESKAKKTQSVNLANPEESESKANYKPITNNQEPITNNQLEKTLIESEFDRFWLSGITKQAKTKALTSFKKQFTEAQKKTKGISEQAFTDYLIGDIKKRIAANVFGFDKMHPTTYLNQQRWNDDIVSGQPEKEERAPWYEHESF